jgi:hypothetical protein
MQRRLAKRNLNGLWICKRSCEIKYPFNKSSRESCKANCEAENIAEAESLYGIDTEPTTSTTGYTTDLGTPTYSIPTTTTSQAGVFGNITNQEALKYGAIIIGGVLIYFIATAKEPTKRKRR